VSPVRHGVAALRVRATSAPLQRLAQGLERDVASRLQQQCNFTQLVAANTPGVDVLVDLNVTGAGRGGTGVIRNSSLITVDSLLVLSDGASGELLGTARIHGESSGVIMPGRSPEGEAVDIVGKAVVDLLAKSGCAGARVPKPQPPPPPQGSDTTQPPPPPQGSDSAPPPETNRADAEALNDQGKEKLRGADLDGALNSFQQAYAMLPDARYEYNVCLALEAQQQWDAASTACHQARGTNGVKAELVVKIDARLTLLQNHQ
jgi:hypothetical protein